MSDLKSKTVDITALAKEFANVLKYNPELTRDEARFDDLTRSIEARLLQVYHAGLTKKLVVEITNFHSSAELKVTLSPEFN